jgi:hypothetical protein
MGDGATEWKERHILSEHRRYREEREREREREIKRKGMKKE